MRRRKNWTMTWVVFIHNVGHVLTEYVDGRATWIRGVKQ